MTSVLPSEERKSKSWLTTKDERLHMEYVDSKQPSNRQYQYMFWVFQRVNIRKWDLTRRLSSQSLDMSDISKELEKLYLFGQYQCVVGHKTDQDSHTIEGFAYISQPCSELKTLAEPLQKALDNMATTNEDGTDYSFELIIRPSTAMLFEASPCFERVIGKNKDHDHWHGCAFGQRNKLEKMERVQRKRKWEEALVKADEPRKKIAHFVLNCDLNDVDFTSTPERRELLSEPGALPFIRELAQLRALAKEKREKQT